jgi:hypothetical protein
MIVMNASLECSTTQRDDFTGMLVDSALAATARHHVRGSSVELELGLFQSLTDVVSKVRIAPVREEILLARLTDAAYHVALAYGTAEPFVDLELDLWRSLRRALRRRAQ